MKQIATITCTFLLVLGSAAVWASWLMACCPDQETAMTQAMDGCATASCCVAQAPVPSRHSGPASVKTSTPVSARTLALPHAAVAAISAEVGPAAGASPAALQTTPVLLC